MMTLAASQYTGLIHLHSEYICVCFRKRTRGRRQTRGFSGKTQTPNSRNHWSADLSWPRAGPCIPQKPWAWSLLSLLHTERAREGMMESWEERWGNDERDKRLSVDKDKILQMWLREIWMGWLRQYDIRAIWLRTLTVHLQDVHEFVGGSSSFLLHDSLFCICPKKKKKRSFVNS